MNWKQTDRNGRKRLNNPDGKKKKTDRNWQKQT